MCIIIGKNVQTDGDVPNYEIMHSSVAYPCHYLENRCF